LITEHEAPPYGSIERTPTTLREVLDVSAQRWGDRIAIVDGDERCTYADLRRRAVQAATGFVDLGVAKGDRVAIWLPNGLDWVVAYFGAIYAGAVVVALNTALSSAEIEYQVAHSGASVLITCRAYRNRDYLAEARTVRAAANPDIAIVAVDAPPEPDLVPWAQVTQTTADERRLPTVEVDDAAIMLFTSGTTGRPKGAVHTHRFVATQAVAAEHLDIDEDDCAVLYLPLFHIYALVAGLVLLTSVGARVVLMARFHAGQSLQLMHDERATIVYGIPTTYIDQMNDPMMECVDLSSIRFAFAPLPYDLCQKVQASFGAPVLNPYGMTETAALVMVAAIGDAQDIRTRTVGRPLKGMQVKVIAEDTGLPVANGTPGMLLMRGPSIMWRYHEQPDATAEALDGEGWLRTGDMVRMDDLGNVTFIGRRGDSYRVGGEIVDPVEIEAALQSHPDVLRAAALGVPDDRLGQVGNAWVQIRPGSAVSEADLQAHAAGLLATFKVPRAVRLIEEFPTTASGKVQKFRLRDSV